MWRGLSLLSLFSDVIAVEGDDVQVDGAGVVLGLDVGSAERCVDVWRAAVGWVTMDG